MTDEPHYKAKLSRVFDKNGDVIRTILYDDNKQPTSKEVADLIVTMANFLETHRLMGYFEDWNEAIKDNGKVIKEGSAWFLVKHDDTNMVYNPHTQTTKPWQ